MSELDLLGYAAVSMLLLTVGIIQWRHPDLQFPGRKWFGLFVVVMFLQSVVMPGPDNRLLAAAGLWCAWMAGQLRWRGWAKALTGFRWALRALSLFVIIDALWHLGRPTWSNPNASAALLLLGLPFNANWLMLVALACTSSRGALLGLGVAALLWIWPRLRKYDPWFSTHFGSIGWRPLLTLAAVAFTAILVGVRTDTVLSRMQHWLEALRLFAASPMLGWGPSNYINVSRIPFQNHADSALLTILAEQGVVGLIALAPLMVVIVLRWRTGGPILVRLMLLALLVQNLFDDTWLGPWPAMLLGLNLAVLWGFNEIPEDTLAGAYAARWRSAAPAPALGPAVE